MKTRWVISLAGIFAFGLAPASVMVSASVMASASAMAGEIVDEARRIEVLSTIPDPQQADRALNGLIAAAHKQTPFKVYNPLFTREGVNAKGLYQERLTNIYKPGETIFVYADLAGYDFLTEDNIFEFHLSVGFRLLAGEQLLGAQDNIQAIRRVAPYPTRSAFFALDYNFEGLIPGTYTLLTLIEDKIGGESDSFALDFIIFQE